jgi:7,8-dihydro-6-hydroxymethylpterin dimethyltransferase
LEVTQKCTLGCPVCFANSKATAAAETDPSLAVVEDWYERVMAAAGPCNIQLSGGEPTMRDDLEEIIALGRKHGLTFIQLNTNGLRLAQEAGYAQKLAKAGLTTVFLQFDGLDERIHQQLRGRSLALQKLAAIERCGAAGLGVVLVPTLVPGVKVAREALGVLLRSEPVATLFRRRALAMGSINFNAEGWFTSGTGKRRIIDDRRRQA